MTTTSTAGAPADHLLKSEEMPPQTGVGAADQAAAAMRAEFAQQYADVERSVDVKKNTPPAPMVALSEEVIFLARQLRQPPELVAQLLVLAEVRGMRADLSQLAFVAQLRTAHVL